MNAFLLTSLLLSLGLVVLFVFVSLRLSRKLLQFDELVELLAHDIETNLAYFEKLLSTATYSNSQEVMTAQRNMRFMAQRLDEYVSRFEELTQKGLRKPAEKQPNRPVVA